MEKHEFLWDFDEHECLSPEKSARFQESVVWSAIDYLWGGDFRHECMPGNELTKRVLMDPDKNTYCELNVSFGGEVEDEDDENQESVAFSATLILDETYDVNVLDMVIAYRAEHFTRVHKKDMSKKDRRRLTRRAASEIEDVSYKARDITTYSFGLLDTSGFSVSRHQDLYQEGSYVWSTQKVLVGEEELFDPLADALNQELKESVTYTDCFQIRAALEALKVPLEVLRFEY